jgi:(E)-4-hydroxy-3-methylbut-2-enyl-diphosphate synthase
MHDQQTAAHAFQIKRKTTRSVKIGSVEVGGAAPISVQSMTNTPTHEVDRTVTQIHRLETAGCEIVRVAVPDEKAAVAISTIKQQISIPLIADVHFDYRLALTAMTSGADGLRINPGNIGSPKNVQAVVDVAKDRQVPIRIGVNAGSLEKRLLEEHGGATAEAMVASAQGQIRWLHQLGYDHIKVSLKASDIPRTVAAYRLLAAQSDVPLHVGVTEAGGLFPGVVKSAIGIGTLLAEGIGDTLRVSLTRDPVEEVRVGYEILRALDIRHRGPEIISCPTCGRCEIDLFGVVEAVEAALLNQVEPMKIAIMGCVVNGPGEAREADIGIAGGRGKGVLFKKGRIVKKVGQKNMVAELLRAVDEHLAAR